MTQDTNTLLASLVEKMEKELRPITTPQEGNGYQDQVLDEEHNAAIDQCITIIKEAIN